MVRIRLARRGRKKKPIYNIVVADVRAPRDGRFIEKLGVYNPHTSPSTIELKIDSAVDWLLKGAQPSETARSLLSKMGVMLKKHLQVGVNKKAITQEVADQRFEEWRSKYWGKNRFVIYEQGVTENPMEAAIRVEDLEVAAQAHESKELAETETVNEAEIIQTSEVQESTETETAVQTEENPKTEVAAEVQTSEVQESTETAVQTEENTETEPAAEVKEEMENKTDPESEKIG